MLQLSYPHLEQRTGIPCQRDIDFVRLEESPYIKSLPDLDRGAIRTWFGTLNKNNPLGVTQADLSKFWKDHRTQRAVELAVLWGMAYTLKQYLWLLIQKEVKISWVLWSWNEDIYCWTDGFLILPNWNKIPVDITSNEQKLIAIPNQVQAGSIKLLYFIEGKIAHALASSLDNGLRNIHANPEDTIASFNSHRYSNSPRWSAHIIMDSKWEDKSLEAICKILNDSLCSSGNIRQHVCKILLEPAKIKNES